MTNFFANLPDTPQVYSARYRRADGDTELVTVTRIDRGAGKAHILRDDQEGARDHVVAVGDLSSFIPLETRSIVVAEDGSVTDFFSTSVYDVPSDWDGDAVDRTIAVQALEPAGPVTHPEDVNRAQTALTQCQHVAYDAMVEIENAGADTTLGDLIEKGKEALDLISSIAESGCPTVEFVAMLARSRREEDGAEEGSATDGALGPGAAAPAASCRPAPPDAGNLKEEKTDG